MGLVLWPAKYNNKKKRKGSGPVSRVLYHRVAHSASPLFGERGGRARASGGVCHLSNPQVAPMALASYPPSSFSFFENGLSEQLSLVRWFTRTCSLWKSTAHGSPQWLVGSYPTFSPLPLHWHLTAVGAPRSGGCFLLLSPAVASGFHFQKQSALCCPDFPLAPSPSRSTSTTRHAVTGGWQKTVREKKGPATNQATALPRAKVIKLFHSTSICYAIFFISKRE